MNREESYHTEDDYYSSSGEEENANIGEINYYIDVPTSTPCSVITQNWQMKNEKHNRDRLIEKERRNMKNIKEMEDEHEANCWECNEITNTKERKYEAEGACGNDEDGYGNTYNHRKTEHKELYTEQSENEFPDVFHIDMDIDNFITQEIKENNLPMLDIGYIEGTLKLNHLEITKDNQYVNEENFQMNDIIPEEYRWNEFDEICMGICKPSLEKKMKEMRTRRSEITENEYIKLHAEIQEAKMIELHRMEKGKLEESLSRMEKMTEETLSALNMAVQDKEIAIITTKTLKTELEAKEEELTTMKISNSRKENIIEKWEIGMRENEKEIIRVRKENKKLLEEIKELRLTLQELRKQGRKKT